MTTYNTGNPIGSTEVKDLYDNAQNFDTLSTTTTLETVPDRLGVPRMSLHGFAEEAKRRLESIKFQPPIPYAPGIEVTTSSLTVDYLGVIYYALPSALPFTTGAWNPAQWSPLQNTYPGHELLVFDDYAAASAAAATLPDGQTLVVKTDELRDGRRTSYRKTGGVLVFAEYLDLVGQDGASKVGTTDGRTVQAVLQETVSLTQFGTITGVDDTAILQAAFDFIRDNTSAELITVGGITSSYAATLPKLRIPKCRLKISSELTVPAYIDIEADNAILEQIDSNKDIFSGEGYQWKIKGMIFAGGRHHVNVYNSNVDTTMFDLEDNEFHLSSDYAIKTSATGGWSHLSANLKIHGKTRFLKCKRILDNCCDSAELTGWFYIDKSNFDPSTAAIRNRAPGSHPRLFLKNFFGVPAMGTPGVDRVENARWIDNYGSVYATGSRFGGEDAGLSILWHYAPQPTAAPYLGYETVFDGCWLFGGPSSRADSGVVLLQGDVPQRISIKNCLGPSDAPFVVNLGASVTFPGYFTAWESATGRKAYNHFSLDIRGNTTDGSDGTIYGARIPEGLRPYVVGAKQTIVRRAASQPMPNGFPNTLVAFDTVESDNVGGFSAANPTRLVMPPGCTKMRITVSVLMASDGTAKTLAATLVDSAFTRISGDTILRGINGDGDRFSFTADVSAAPGNYWHVNIQHNSTSATLNLLDCRVSLTPLDYVG